MYRLDQKLVIKIKIGMRHPVAHASYLIPRELLITRHRLDRQVGELLIHRCNRPKIAPVNTASMLISVSDARSVSSVRWNVSKNPIAAFAWAYASCTLRSSFCRAFIQNQPFLQKLLLKQRRQIMIRTAHKADGHSQFTFKLISQLKLSAAARLSRIFNIEIDVASRPGITARLRAEERDAIDLGMSSANRPNSVNNMVDFARTRCTGHSRPPDHR